MGWINKLFGFDDSKRFSSVNYNEDEDDTEDEEEDEEDDNSEEDKDIKIICPYCEMIIIEPRFIGIDDDVGDSWNILCCENCNKVLVGGVS